MVDLKTQKSPFEINWPIVPSAACPTDKFIPGSIALLYLRNFCFDQFINILLARSNKQFQNYKSWIFLKLIVSELVVVIQEQDKWAHIKLSLFTQCLFLISSFISCSQDPATDSQLPKYEFSHPIPIVQKEI